MTGYVVLEQDDSGAWRNAVPPVEAVSAEAAIRKAIDGGGASSTYVAIPVRSFKPVTVTVETKRVVKLA